MIMFFFELFGYICLCTHIKAHALQPALARHQSIMPFFSRKYTHKKRDSAQIESIRLAK